jgi:hypothetical protein
MTRFCCSILIAMSVGACSGEPQEKGASSERQVVSAIDGKLLSQSWPARMANDAARAPFETHAGWRHIFENELGPALEAFAETKHARGMSRVHQHFSDLYAQGALLAANATTEAYGTDAADTDPESMAYVLGVSAAIRGDYVGAQKHFGAVPPDSEVSERASQWNAAIQEQAQVPDLGVLTVISGSLGEVVPGTQPPVASIPHFEFPERSVKALPMKVNDPTALLAHAAWHGKAAQMVAPETDGAVLEQIGLRYTVQSVNAPTQASLPLDDAWLFCSADLSSADAGFIAEASSGGIAAVESWAEKSILAAALKPAIKDGRVVPQAVMDSAFAIQKQLSATMADVGGGQQGFHRPFALRARIAVLMAGMIVADANDQYRDAGILRLNALERMESVGTDPVFALSVAAWDAGNRNPMRPEDLLHQFGSSYPALVVARAPLEALHLRRSRNAAPTTPVH